MSYAHTISGGLRTRPSSRGLFALAEREREARLPATARAVTLAIAAFLVAALVFSAVTPLRELVRAPGRVVPATHSTAIEHVVGGIIAEVAVKEGAIVAAGDVLARLDAPELRQQIAQTRDALAQVQIRAQTVALLLSRANGASVLPDSPVNQSQSKTAILSDDPYANARHAVFLARQQVLADRILQMDATISTLSKARDVARDRVADQADQVTRLSRLADKGHVSTFRLLDSSDRLGELRGELATAEVALVRSVSDREAERSKMRENALTHHEALLKEAFDLEEQARALKVEVAGLQQQRDGLTIRAPQPGVIQSVAFPVPGEVIGPDTELFELLPTGVALVAEVKLEPQDIGHVTVGDAVSLKLQTFDFRRFGGITGKIASLSPTSVTEPDGTSHFRAIVTLDADHVGEGASRRDIRTGMDVSAEIQTNSRTVLQYLLKPLDASLQAALTER